MTQFNIDDLYNLTDCIRNAIQDNKDYCIHDAEYEETQQRLQALLCKVEAQISQAHMQVAA